MNTRYDRTPGIPSPRKTPQALVLAYKDKSPFHFLGLLPDRLTCFSSGGPVWSCNQLYCFLNSTSLLRAEELWPFVLLGILNGRRARRSSISACGLWAG